MLDDLMGQMKNMMDAQKNTLNEVEIDIEKEGVKITITGNKQIKDVSIADSLLKVEDKEMLEDLLLAAMNEAIQKADAQSAQSLKGLADGLIPGGLDDLF